MKKNLIGMIAIVLAITITAFTAKPVHFNSDDTQYHWFDSEFGLYLGQRTIPEQEALCPGDGSECADSYTGMQNNQPAGSFVTTVEKE